MRLFAALPLSASATERLFTLQLRLCVPRDGLRWSTPGQWHITLRFFGDLEETAVRCLEQKLLRLSLAAPTLSLRALGLFAGKGVLYAAVAHSAELHGLHAAVQQIGAACDSPLESRPFTPHITLARSKGKIGNQFLQQLAHPELPSLGAPIEWHPPALLLLESTLRPSGAEYTVRCRVPFSLPELAGFHE